MVNEPVGDLTIYNPSSPLVISGTDWTIHTFKVAEDPGMYYYSLDDGQPEGSPQPNWTTYRSIWRKYKSKTQSNRSFNSPAPGLSFDTPYTNTNTYIKEEKRCK